MMHNYAHQRAIRYGRYAQLLSGMPLMWGVFTAARIGAKRKVPSSSGKTQGPTKRTALTATLVRELRRLEAVGVGIEAEAAETHEALLELWRELVEALEERKQSEAALFRRRAEFEDPKIPDAFDEHILNKIDEHEAELKDIEARISGLKRDINTHMAKRKALVQTLAQTEAEIKAIEVRIEAANPADAATASADEDDADVFRQRMAQMVADRSTLEGTMRRIEELITNATEEIRISGSPSTPAGRRELTQQIAMRNSMFGERIANQRALDEINAVIKRALKEEEARIERGGDNQHALRDRLLSSLAKIDIKRAEHAAALDDDGSDRLDNERVLRELQAERERVELQLRELLQDDTESTERLLARLSAERDEDAEAVADAKKKQADADEAAMEMGGGFAFNQDAQDEVDAAEESLRVGEFLLALVERLMQPRFSDDEGDAMEEVVEGDDEGGDEGGEEVVEGDDEGGEEVVEGDDEGGDEGDAMDEEDAEGAADGDALRRELAELEETRTRVVLDRHTLNARINEAADEEAALLAVPQVERNALNVRVRAANRDKKRIREIKRELQAIEEGLAAAQMERTAAGKEEEVVDASDDFEDASDDAMDVDSDSGSVTVDNTGAAADEDETAAARRARRRGLLTKDRVVIVLSSDDD